MHRLCLAVLAAMPLAAAAHAQPMPYALVQTVKLGAPDKWDYVSFDPKADRVYIAHGTGLTVVDGHDGTVVGEVPGLTAAHGAAIDPASHHGYAGTGRSEVLVFDAETLKPIKTLAGAPDDDGVVDDPASHRAFVMNGDSRSATVIDTATDTAQGQIDLGGKPEFAAVDGRGKLYVNLADTREVVRVDIASHKIDARWAVPDCVSPHGIAVDPATGRIFTSCVDGKLIVTDSGTGARVASLAIGKGSDAVVFDPVRKLVLSSNGDGTLSVIREESAGRFANVAEMPTAKGARTLAVDPASGRVFLVTADVDQVKPPRAAGYAPRYSFKPGTVKLLMLDPAGAAQP